MKKFRSILSIVLAALVLVSSTSFIVGMHYCSGEIQHIALFTKAESCEMEMSMPPCHRQDKSSCCDDETVIHSGEDFNVNAAAVTIPFAQFVTLAFSSVILKEIIPTADVSKVSPFHYDSRWRERDLTIAFKVFLI